MPSIYASLSHLQCLIGLDYTKLLGLAAQNDNITQSTSYYFNELALLHSGDLAAFSSAQLAAGSILLARLTLHKGKLFILLVVSFFSYNYHFKRCLYCSVKLMLPVVSFFNTSHSSNHSSLCCVLLHGCVLT